MDVNQALDFIANQFRPDARGYAEVAEALDVIRSHLEFRPMSEAPIGLQILAYPTYENHPVVVSRWSKRMFKMICDDQHLFYENDELASYEISELEKWMPLPEVE